jgi:hypothetical protein
MYMQDKLQRARWIIYKVAFALAAAVVLWKLIIR